MRNEIRRYERKIKHQAEEQMVDAEHLAYEK